MPGVGRPVLTVFFGIAKALFQYLSSTLIHLSGMFLSLEIEERMILASQETRDVQV